MWGASPRTAGSHKVAFLLPPRNYSKHTSLVWGITTSLVWGITPAPCVAASFAQISLTFSLSKAWRGRIWRDGLGLAKEELCKPATTFQRSHTTDIGKLVKRHTLKVLPSSGQCACISVSEGELSRTLEANFCNFSSAPSPRPEVRPSASRERFRSSRSQCRGSTITFISQSSVTAIY